MTDPLYRELRSELTDYKYAVLVAETQAAGIDYLTEFVLDDKEEKLDKEGDTLVGCVYSLNKSRLLICAIFTRTIQEYNYGLMATIAHECFHIFQYLDNQVDFYSNDPDKLLEPGAYLYESIFRNVRGIVMEYLDKNSIEYDYIKDQIPYPKLKTRSPKNKLQIELQ